MLDGISVVSNALSLRYMHVSKIHKMQKEGDELLLQINDHTKMYLHIRFLFIFGS